SARSPDLTLLDYFLCGYLKDQVYKVKPRNLNDLRDQILDEAALIPNEYIKDAVSGFYHQLAHCQTMNGCSVGFVRHSLFSFENHFDVTFPHRWIGRDSPIWGPRSPDLTPPDFYLRGFLKDAVFFQPPATRQDMMDSI
ncbi:hypothetical protein EAI_14920, partial [Harpegnathos saltator]